MRELRSAWAMWTKAMLLLLLGLGSGALLLWSAPSWQHAALLACCVFGCCRAYYFAFYVIEHWLDPGFRYAGLLHFVRHRLSSRRRGSLGDRPSATDQRLEATRRGREPERTA